MQLPKKEKRIAELEALANGRNVLYNTLTDCGFEGSEQEMADVILAQQKQSTPEEIRAEREKQNALSPRSYQKRSDIQTGSVIN